MKITHKTLTKDILPLLSEDSFKELLEKVPSVPLKKPILSMTVGEFSEIVESEELYIANILKTRKALKAFGMLKQYKQEMEALSGFIKRFDTKRSPEEEAAAKGVLFPSFIQRILIDCVNWFHLNSMKEAEKVKLSEWLTFWQNEAANMLYQRNYMSIMDAKHKAQRK